MTFGEKLQRLRKSRGLSQDELAGRLSVSRQAVSRWELNETMPETENVIQLSRIFEVSTDYLLLDEKESWEDQPEAVESHLSPQGWAHNAFVLSVAACVAGLLLGGGIWLLKQTEGPLIVGLIIQVFGITLFELAASRMDGERRFFTRTRFYTAACWLVLPVPMTALCRLLITFACSDLWVWSLCIVVYVLVCAAVTAVMARLRRRHARKP